MLQIILQPAFFKKSIPFCFLEKIRNKMEQIYINNENQEVFIAIITNYKLSVFLLCLLCEILVFKKNTDPKNHIILFLFCRHTDPVYFAALRVDQKINFASPYVYLQTFDFLL